MKKKKNNCINCIYFNDSNCHKNGNVGILVKRRQESIFYIKTPQELNNGGDCKNYAKA